MAGTNEWSGMEVVFDIAKRGEKTDVCFTHAGLWPDHESFRGFSSAWSSLIRTDAWMNPTRAGNRDDLVTRRSTAE